jgi:hypothetical protein
MSMLIPFITLGLINSFRLHLQKSVLARSSQPCVGLKAAKSSTDERMLSALKTPDQETLYILDSRPQLNAVANMLRGGGYENANTYKVRLIPQAFALY